MLAFCARNWKGVNPAALKTGSTLNLATNTAAVNTTATSTTPGILTAMATAKVDRILMNEELIVR